MNIPVNRYLLIASWIFTSTLSSAYELVTHGLVTNQAYNLSRLTQSPSLLVQLGFNGAQPPLSDVYFDFGPQTGNVVFARRAQLYEEAVMRRAGVRQPIGILGWIQRGAIREDDGGVVAATKAGEPLDDPYDNFNRFCNHFLDPITRNPLSSTFLSDTLSFVGCPNGTNTNAANWAMGAASGNSDAFSNNPGDANSRNHFSIFAAREAMWRALTLRRKDGTPAPRPDVLYSLPSWTKEDDRKAYWATAFRAVGDMLHLNQDMAQPQHTRNEGHGLAHAALYEKYVDARAKREAKFEFDGEGRLLQEVGQLPVLPVATPYPTPRFTRYSDYWSDAQGAASISAGKGLADYSSRGFFTPAKNLGTAYTGFPDPINIESAYSMITALGNCTSTPGRAQYATGKLPDDFLVTNDPSTKVKYASRSLVAGQWSLNRCVFEERVNLLIPRAVAYSAGLIDYFFRGQLEITPPAEGIYSLVDHFDFSGAGKTATVATTGFKGFKTIKLKLRNTTPDINPSGGGSVAPQQMQNGKLVAVLKFYRNKAYTDNLANEPATVAGYNDTRSTAEEIVVSARVKDENGAPVNTISLSSDPATPAKLLYFEFDQELPINATDVKLQVVYRGPLGSEEDAVVVETVDISEPTYFVYMNTLDYIRLNAKVYTRAEINSKDPPPVGELSGSQLRALVRPTNCIDPMTDQLRASCFLERAINFPLRVGTASTENNTTLQFALPQVRTYVRMAMLTPRGVPALLDQRDSSCVPRDIFPLRGRNVQTDYSTDADGSPRISTVVDLDPPPVRGVYGYVLSCVEIGDGIFPGTNDTDNRDTKMAPLTGDALKPILLENFKFGAP